MRKFILFVMLGMFVGTGLATEKQPATISRATIEKRLEGLKQAHQQAIANAQALGGAVQDCEYWLAELDKTEKEASQSDGKTKQNKEKKNGD